MIKALKLDVEELQILEISLRGNDFDIQQRRNLLKIIGQGLVDNEPRVLPLQIEDIWYLRGAINPDIVIGDYTGLTLITRLYSLIVGLKMPREGQDYTIIEPGEGGSAN